MNETTVKLISWTKDPVETIFEIWQQSKQAGWDADTDLTTPDEKAKLFKLILAQNIPVGENIDFVFMIYNDPISHREQMVRHRIGVTHGENIGVDLIPDLDKSSWWSQCLGGDTEIKLLDGRNIPIRELVGGGDIKVYSCLKSGQVVFGDAYDIRRTGENKDIYRVTLDNGKVFDAMLNHPIMLRDGCYKILGDMNIGDSIMPLYCEIDDFGYERIVNNKTGKWNLTHRMVVGELKKGECSHHVNFNKLNNHPNNLKTMLVDDHFKYHSDHINFTNNSLKNKKENDRKVSEGNKRYWRNLSDGERLVKLKLLEQAGKLRNKCEIISTARKTMNKNWENVEFREKMLPILAKQGGWNKGMVMERDGVKYNHKMIYIEYLGKQDVYDMSVRKYNNFALSAGIFVHNSMRIMDMGKFFENENYHIPESVMNNKSAYRRYQNVMEQIQEGYRNLLSLGIPMEDARNLLPLGTTMDISWKVNLSSLLHIIKKRTCWILQSSLWMPVITGMVEELVKKVDTLFADIALPACYNKGKFHSCVYELENERRCDGRDRLPACPLYVDNDMEDHHRHEYCKTLGQDDEMRELMETKITEYSKLWQKRLGVPKL